MVEGIRKDIWPKLLSCTGKVPIYTWAYLSLCKRACTTVKTSVLNSEITSISVLQWMLCLEIVVLVRLSTIYVKRRFTSKYYRHALAPLALPMVKHSVLDASGAHFSSCNIDAVLDFVCTA